jgi:hypothetical protein
MILVENASRFARDLAVQLAGHSLRKQRGIELVPVDAPNHFTDETPTATMVRQILGAVSEFEKAGVVHKLRVARDAKRAKTGKCEGRKSHAEVNPNAVASPQTPPEESRDWEAYVTAQDCRHDGHARAYGNLGQNLRPLRDSIDAGPVGLIKPRALHSRRSCAADICRALRSDRYRSSALACLFIAECC